MKLTWFSWKDISHPLAGGAEIVSHNIRERLARDGHSVVLYTSRYKNSARVEIINGVEYRRLGNRYSVYLLCLMHFLVTSRLDTDIIIDEMNTLPFWVGAFTKKPKLLLSYQLAREVWHYQMIRPLSSLGYYIEPAYVRLLSRIYDHVATESQSTANELAHYGHKSVHIFRVGMAVTPLDSFGKSTTKQLNNVVFLGALRPMKRPIDAIGAFELAKESLPSLNLTLIGSDRDKYAGEVRSYVQQSKFKSSIELLGSVSDDQKAKVLRGAGVILVTSIKEGWGLIVTEAGSMGTPAIAYNADGLRDSILDKQTGLLADNSSVTDLAEKIVSLLSDKKTRDKYAKNAWEFSKQFTFENSYEDFVKIINIVAHK